MILLPGMAPVKEFQGTDEPYVGGIVSSLATVDDAPNPAFARQAIACPDLDRCCEPPGGPCLGPTDCAGGCQSVSITHLATVVVETYNQFGVFLPNNSFDGVLPIEAPNAPCDAWVGGVLLGGGRELIVSVSCFTFAGDPYWQASVRVFFGQIQQVCLPFHRVGGTPCNPTGVYTFGWPWNGTCAPLSGFDVQVHELTIT